MIQYFNLNNNHHKLFSKIGLAISKLYPIGLEREVPAYQEYEGIKKIMAVIGENMTNNKQFSKPWKSFLKILSSESGNQIYSTSMPLDISYSGECVLEKYEDEALRRVKRIAVSVSIVAPFYTIYGIDETFIKMAENENASGYHAINVVTESPYIEFYESFKLIKGAIDLQWPEYSFVPIRIGLMQVKGLQTPYGYLEESSVHSALFNEIFESNSVRCFRGDMYWGSGPSNVTVNLVPPTDS